MVCPKCSFEQPEGAPTCARCGVIFAKVRCPTAAGRAHGGSSAPVAASLAARGILPSLRQRLLVPRPGEPTHFVVGRGILLAVMLFWGWRFSTATISSGYAAQTFLHLIVLPFHEAGHVIFGLLGVRFLTVLGGTLGQLLVPLVVLCAFAARRNLFGSSVALWWLGQSLMDVAVYADDARAGELMLLGGVTGSEVEDYHDWEVMLRTLGWLHYDHLIARLFYGCGIALMLLALLWGAAVVWGEYRLREGGGGGC